MMRRVLTGVAVTLLLAACDSPAEPGPAEPTPPAQSPLPAASTVQRATEAELAAVCDALDKTLTLPGDGTVPYAARFKNAEFGTNTPMCAIAPEGEYSEVAAKTPLFGRAHFNYGRYTDAEMQSVRYRRYTPETAEELLRVDEANPLTDEVPCAKKPCKNGINGYAYDFRFEAVIGDNISVNARFDYITTDVTGDQKPQYRAQAIEAFKASMDVIAAELNQ
jgi:hypothetical protein